MYCPYCKQPVFYEERQYVKIVPEAGRSDAFYHLKCFQNLTGITFYQQRDQSVMFPTTSLGESV